MSELAISREPQVNYRRLAGYLALGLATVIAIDGVAASCDKSSGGGNGSSSGNSKGGGYINKPRGGWGSNNSRGGGWPTNMMPLGLGVGVYPDDYDDAEAMHTEAADVAVLDPDQLVAVPLAEADEL